MSSTSATPVEDAIRSKITGALHPSVLEIRNDSHLHSHHKAMEFKSKMQPARHRMVYALLKEELDKEGGIHALQLRTKTSEEEDKLKSRAEAAR